jgi:hypothetical protein
VEQIATFFKGGKNEVKSLAPPFSKVGKKKLRSNKYI